MVEKTMLSKRKLYLVKVLEEKPDSPVLNITAKDLSREAGDPFMDKPLRFGIFAPELREYVKALPPETNNIFLADYQESPNKNPEYGPNRTIVQIYDKDGKPMSAKKQGWGGPRGKSAEEIASEETMCRARIIADLWAMKTLTLEDPLVTKLRTWLDKFSTVAAEKRSSIGSHKPDSGGPTPPPATTTKVAATAPPSSVTTTTETEPHLKNRGDLCDRMRNYGVKLMKHRDAVIAKAGYQKVDEIIDLDAAWVKIKAVILTEQKEQKKMEGECATTAVVNIAPGADAVVLSLRDQVIGLLKYAEARSIATDDDAKRATEDLSLMMALKKAIAEKRQEYVGPLNDHLKSINKRPTT